jgi:hypothetical protein
MTQTARTNTTAKAGVRRARRTAGVGNRRVNNHRTCSSVCDRFISAAGYQKADQAKTK